MSEEPIKPEADVKRITTEVEQIGNKVVKVQLTEFIGKRKKKVTHIEVTQAELDQMVKGNNKKVSAQLTMF